MTIEEYNAFCAALPATTHVVQWGDAEVWKVGGKVFTIGRWEGGVSAVTFKVSPIAYEMLRDQPGLRPAPYLASRGLKWIQHYAAPGVGDGGLGDADLRDYLRAAHHIVSQGLSRKARRLLGLAEA
ncbi:MAG: MmcQ/YjbR family DNA-binding protein [Alphaproteobacteria bacterium]|nr:MmcQ/YjbR family DNA-binding protein [Alphaproteobacteria bacterium]